MNKIELTYFPAWTAGRRGYAERIRAVFEEYIRKKGLFHTPQRMTILNHLLEAEKHLSQDEIYKALKKKGIGKVTVFRTLKVLEDCGLVEKVSSPGGTALYEVQMERPHHDHLICVECNRIMEIQWPEVEKIQEKTCRKLGFSIVWHRHEIFGRCSECQGAAPKA